MAPHFVLQILMVFVAVSLSAWAYLLIRLSRQPTKFAQYWGKPVGQSGGLLYVAMGDSAAQGIGATSPQKGYVSLLARSIQQKSGKSVQIVNLSKTGATIDDVISDQLPLLRFLKPDIITLGIGGNDLRSYRAADFDASITKLISQLPKNTFIADTPYFMHGKWEQQALEASRVLTRQARLHGLTVAPLHKTMQDKGWQSMFYMYAADWFHPNNKGHKVWHNAFWKVIKPQL